MATKNQVFTLVKRKVHNIDPEAKIILFGSRATKTARSDSDWDFLILTKRDVTPVFKNRITDSLFEAELETDELISGIVQNIFNWNSYSSTPIYMHINENGIEL
ncbi:MAG: nucleotidyltransferase domain-containing protein [Bacteroidetes bacterium]|nr:nucleotidyltransferase domain-containing protein [Bacteroidota bacterium]MBU1717456.1 nucleotidyltransferase domain-containing protein [Bacteroidota bacterium]